jgi:hypothetical protein
MAVGILSPVHVAFLLLVAQPPATQPLTITPAADEPRLSPAA